MMWNYRVTNDENTYQDAAADADDHHLLLSVQQHVN